MSNADVPPPAAGQVSPAVDATPAFDEIRIYSHSPLFYWWPVWLFGFIFSLITLMDNDRMAIVPAEALLVKESVEGNKFRGTIYGPVQEQNLMGKITADASQEQKDHLIAKNPNFPRDAKNVYELRPHVSARSWMGPTYLIILVLVIIITSVPLRGLWSLVVLIALVVLALMVSLFKWWDDILGALYGLHIFINLAGYLMLSTAIFVSWAVATFIFDRRSYIVFTPGQIRVCEEIGSRERTYDTTGMTIEKHRDDWFRHIFLGFGSGDLSVRTAGADRNEILMPNVALIGFKIEPIQQLIRQRQIDTSAPHAPRKG
ncbi:MAG TPA: hypothetical protein VHR66_20685 [Gemmataceae bacterium]|jgi:uncharacterized membrane protein YgcG|nr:hypothetical protein [Gemmataceae bacterium]